MHIYASEEEATYIHALMLRRIQWRPIPPPLNLLTNNHPLDLLTIDCKIATTLCYSISEKEVQ
jgi:hypothetical protein